MTSPLRFALRQRVANRKSHTPTEWKATTEKSCVCVQKEAVAAIVRLPQIPHASVFVVNRQQEQARFREQRMSNYSNRTLLVR